MIQRHGAVIERANAAHSSDADPDERLIYAVPVPITRLYASADQPAGSVSEPWFEAAKKMALDPSVFDRHPPFPFRAHISNQRTDSYYTRMHESTLQNFAADATQGVSFQNSHRDTELGFGRSFRGEYLGSPGNGTARTEADFYTIPGLNLNGVSTDDLIRGMQAGIVKDVSVGFYGGYYRCPICERRLFTGDCRHVPGLTYNRDGQRTDDPNAAPSVAWVHDSHLAEVSAVYDGSCPNAAIMKARQLSEAGYLPLPDAHLLEERYRIRLPASHQRWPGADLTPPEEKPMPEDPKTTPDVPTPVPFEPVRALLHEVGITVGDDPLPGLRDLVTELRTLRPLKAENERLAKEADDGRTYRADLTAEALREGVRAYGATFPEEQYKTQFADAPLDFIKTNRDLWTVQAGEKLQPGRQSADVGDPEPAAAPTGKYTHPSAYAG